MRPGNHDRFDRLRADMATFRQATAGVTSIAWCVSCEVHHAARAGGFCPVCEDDQEGAAA